MWPDERLLAVWAKSGDPCHPLIGHMLDTAAVTMAVLAREPASTLKRYAQSLNLEEEAALRFLAALAGAHDLGKATPVFQGMASSAQAGLPYPWREPEWVAHGVLTELLLERLLREAGVSRRAAKAMSRGVGAHHGFLATSNALSKAQLPDVKGDSTWEEARRSLFNLLLRTVGVTAVPPVQVLDENASVGIAALASFCDWIASDPDHFPYGRDLSDLGAYWKKTLSLGDRALTSLGWRPRRPLVGVRVSFDKVFPFSPNPLQQRVSDVVSQANEPVLLLVEAPMGIGKTEAALYAHVELQRALGHRGLYIALPTMATGNGMFPRVRKFLDSFSPGEAPFDLQLQHGSAFLNPQYQTLSPSRIDEPGGAEEQTVLVRQWFGAKKRAMLSEYGVGTVDQALLGVLRVRHHFIRLWGLGNRTVVLDEVHAYDAYTSGIIEAFVRWMRALGSSVILMSATLPSSRRRALVSAYGAELPPMEAPYPRLTVVCGNRVASHEVEAGAGKILKVEPTDRAVKSVAVNVLAEVCSGGCAACVVNTVDRAQQLYEAFGSGQPIFRDGLIVGKNVNGVEVYLFHARYPAGDRQKREEVCLELFGAEGYRQGTRPDRAVLVATQVIEQSLDLDFDVMYSDLAPVDLLFQRAGRLHRFNLAELSRRLQRPLVRPTKHSAPRLLVAALRENPPGLEIEHWSRVYCPYLLLATWWALRGRDEIRLPGDIENLIESVYEEGIPGGLAPELCCYFQKEWDEFRKSVEEQRVWAHAAAITDPSQFLTSVPVDELAGLDLDDDEEGPLSQVPLTRLGEPSVAVVPLHRIADGLYLDSEGRKAACVDGELTDDEAKELFLRSVRLGRPDVYHVLSRKEPPRAWRKHPLLRRTRILELVDGEVEVGKTRIILDRELGVRYV